MVKREADLDLVLLALQIPSSLTTQPAEIGGSSGMPLDSPLYALGFPGKSDLSPAIGILSTRSGPKGRWQTTLGINRGNSGGPIFDPKTNKIVAIAWAGDDSAQQITYVIPETYASGLLQIAGSAVITQKVKAGINQDPDVMGSNVVLHSTEGLVMLRGFALSDAAKVKAGEIAAKVEGVKQVKNDIQVLKIRDRYDEAITTAVKLKFFQTHNIKDVKVAIGTLDGLVVLSGFAESYVDSDNAVAMAMEVTGVKAVKNDIFVYAP